MSTKDNPKRQASLQIRQSKSNIQSKVNLQMPTAANLRRLAPSQTQQEIRCMLQNCIFCQKLYALQSQDFGPLLTKALYAKYSSSQNYYFSKDINDILEQETTPATVNYRDLEAILEEEEYLKRLYLRKEIKGKKQALLEYYKYHKDIPRLFMQHMYTSINRFHDKRRRLEYARIKRNLGLPDDDEHTKHLTNDKQDKKGSKDISVKQLGNMLKGVNFDESVKPKHKQLNSKEVSYSNSLSFHLNDLLITINNQKVIQYNRPTSGYQIGVDLSIFEQSLNTFNKPFEDISMISQTAKTQLKGVLYEEYKNTSKKKSNPVDFGQQSIPHLTLNKLRQTSVSPDVRNSILLLAPSLLKQQSVQQLIKPKNNVVSQYGAQTERVKQLDPVSHSERQKLQIQQKPKDNIQILSQKILEKHQSQQRIQINSNSIDHYSNTNLNLMQQISTLSRANSNYTKLEGIPFAGQNVNSPNRTILKSNFTDIQNLRSNNNSQQKLNPTNKIQVNMDFRQSKNSSSVLFQGQTVKDLLITNTNGQQNPIQIQQQNNQYGRTRSQDYIPSPAPTATIVPVYVKGAALNRPPSSHRPSKSDIFNSVDLKKIKPTQNYANNIYLPGAQKKTPSYTINQNNIVNIYLSDPKSQSKSNKTNGGSVTSRGISPSKTNRKIFDCEVPPQKK